MSAALNSSVLSWRRIYAVPFKLPLGGFQLTGAWPDVGSGYNASVRFLGIWAVGVTFPADTQHIIWRTKLLSRSETPGEPPGSQRAAESRASVSSQAAQLPGWNYTPQNPSNPKGEVGFGVGERNPSFLTQGAASCLLASSHEVFLILGIKTLGNVTLSCLARLLPPPLATHSRFVPLNLHNNHIPILQRGEVTPPRPQRWLGRGGCGLSGSATWPTEPDYACPLGLLICFYRWRN